MRRLTTCLLTCLLMLAQVAYAQNDVPPPPPQVIPQAISPPVGLQLPAELPTTPLPTTDIRVASLPQATVPMVPTGTTSPAAQANLPDLQRQLQELQQAVQAAQAAANTAASQPVRTAAAPADAMPYNRAAPQRLLTPPASTTVQNPTTAQTPTAAHHAPITQLPNTQPVLSPVTRTPHVAPQTPPPTVPMTTSTPTPPPTTHFSAPSTTGIVDKGSVFQTPPMATSSPTPPMQSIVPQAQGFEPSVPGTPTTVKPEPFAGMVSDKTPAQPSATAPPQTPATPQAPAQTQAQAPAPNTSHSHGDGTHTHDHAHDHIHTDNGIVYQSCTAGCTNCGVGLLNRRRGDGPGGLLGRMRLFRRDRGCTESCSETGCTTWRMGIFNRPPTGGLLGRMGVIDNGSCSACTDLAMPARPRRRLGGLLGMFINPGADGCTSSCGLSEPCAGGDVASLFAGGIGVDGCTGDGCTSCGGQCGIFCKNHQTLFHWSCYPNNAMPLARYQPLNTDRPDFTESSSTVGLGVFQIESGYTYLYDNEGGVSTRDSSFGEIAIRYGILAEWLEFRMLLNPIQRRVRSGAGTNTTSGTDDLLMGVKLGLTPQVGYLPETALIAQMFIPTGSDTFTSGEVLPGLNWIYSWSVNDYISLAGSTQANRREDAVTFEPYTEIAQSATMGIGWNEYLGSYFEWFGLFPQGADTDGVQNFLNTGLTLLVTDDLQLDARIGYGLNRGADDYFFGFGAAYRFR